MRILLQEVQYSVLNRLSCLLFSVEWEGVPTTKFALNPQRLRWFWVWVSFQVRDYLISGLRTILKRNACHILRCYATMLRAILVFRFARSLLNGMTAERSDFYENLLSVCQLLHETLLTRIGQYI